MRDSIRRYHAEGGAILAECGGLMACARTLRDAEGREFPMWGLIPARVAMQPRFAALGYVTVAADRPTLLGPPGTQIRGHEFHYSTLELLSPLTYATRLLRPGRDPKPDGIQVGGLLAGYAHLHFGSNPDAARRFLST
jgi:cobyrinic acid a,c-diamide synthase